MSETEKNLEKFVESELQVMSPLLAKSLTILGKADDVVVKDKESLSEAKRQKKEAVEHRSSVKDMRLAFTRKLDGLKASFIEKQDEVLAPSIKAEGILKERINEYEDEQRRLKEVEEARVQAIIDSVQMPKVDRKAITEDEAIRLKVDFDMTVNTIEKKDRNKKAVKEQIVATKSLYEELLTHVRTRDEQIATAVALEKERQELDAKQRELQAAQSIDRPRYDLKVDETSEGRPVDDRSIEQNTSKAMKHAEDEIEKAQLHNDGTRGMGSSSSFSLPDDLGWECNDEISGMMDIKFMEFTRMIKEHPEDRQLIWSTAKAAMMDSMYSIIKKYQAK